MKKKMTKKGLIKALRELRESQKRIRAKGKVPDCERDGMLAENLLLAYIGSPAVSVAFQDVEAW